jgi:heme-degrading monooxygenase HmoA
MYCRLIRFQGKPEKTDEGLKLWSGTVLPALKKQHGFSGVTFLGDRETGVGLSVTYWETEQAMKEAREHGRPEGNKALEMSSGSIVEEDECEVAVLERFEPAPAGSWVRLNSVTTQAAHIADATAIFKARVVPATEKQPGARTAYSFINRQTGRTFTGTTWDTQKHLKDSAEIAAGMREEAIKKFGLQNAKVETFEILFTEILAPAATRL